MERDAVADDIIATGRASGYTDAQIARALDGYFAEKAGKVAAPQDEAPAPVLANPDAQQGAPVPTNALYRAINEPGTSATDAAYRAALEPTPSPPMGQHSWYGDTANVLGNAAKAVGSIAYDNVSRPVGFLGDMGKLAIGAWNAGSGGLLKIPGQGEAEEAFRAMFKPTAEELYQNPLGPAMAVGMVGGATGAKTSKPLLTGKGKTLAQAQADAARSTLTSDNAAINSEIKRLIGKKYEKGVRPTVVGKASEPLMKKAATRQQMAVESIIANKDNLKLTDEYGEPVAGTPQTLRQFSQAIDQTKSKIFSEYDAMAKSAGEGGAVVDMTPVAAELREMAGGKAVNTAAPGTARYISDLADRLEGVKMTPAEAQEAIAIYNKRLEAYFKNPTPETASNAGIDSVVADRLRGRLDAAIEALEGPGYQQLKRQYGALKSIEKEVAHRVVVDARKNNKGLADLIGDVASAGEIAIALATASPAAALRGGGIQAVKAWWKHSNDPNVIVRGMFEKADKLMQKREPGQTAPAGTFSAIETEQTPPPPQPPATGYNAQGMMPGADTPRIPIAPERQPPPAEPPPPPPTPPPALPLAPPPVAPAAGAGQAAAVAEAPPAPKRIKALGEKREPPAPDATPGQRRAAPGGEYGANGEWYEGGKWIANTEAAKRKGSHKGTGRQQVEKGKWEVGPEGSVAIFPQLAGVEIYDSATGKFSFNDKLKADFATPEAIADRKAKIEAYNRGERWTARPDATGLPPGETLFRGGGPTTQEMIALAEKLGKAVSELTAEDLRAAGIAATGTDNTKRLMRRKEAR